MEVKVKIPESLEDIKLSQYQKFLRVTEKLDPETDINTINKRAVAVFCDIPDNIVNNMTKQSFNECLEVINNIIKIDAEKVEFKRVFKFNNQKYGFIPNMDKMTVGEVADLDEYFKDWQKMHKAMAILFRPVTQVLGDRYTIEKYKSDEKPLDLTMDKVLGAYFFLTNLMQDLLNTIPNFIEQEVVANPKYKTLVESGDGINPSMASLKEIFLGLKMSLN